MKAVSASVIFVGLYVWEVIRGGFRIAWDVLTPGMPISERIIDVEVPPLGPMRRLLLANLVSMTPGSLSIDYFGGGSILRIHLLYADTDEKGMRDMIRNLFLPIIQSLPRFSKS